MRLIMLRISDLLGHQVIRTGLFALFFLPLPFFVLFCHPFVQS